MSRQNESTARFPNRRTLLGVAVATLVLVAAVGCEVETIEFVNETDGPITLALFVPVDDDEDPLIESLEPGETLITRHSSRTPDERWVITDQDGVLLMEVVINYDLVDYFDSRIVVR